jgi:starch-binding outer membrane protein, SusD/RagB family
MKKLLRYSMVVIMLFTSCDSEGLMDTTELDELTPERIYSDVEYTRRILYDLYGRMRQETNANNGSFSRLFNMATAVSLLDNATDDGAGNTTRTAGIIPRIQQYVTAGITASTNPVDNQHPWTWYYTAIRNANIFLANVMDSPLGAAEKQSSYNQARFLRAYYYHELLRWFGPLVISTEPLDPFAFETTRREDIQNTVKFIIDEFDVLSQPGALPDQWGDADYGRATRGAAMAYKARTMLYAASPLHQGSGVTWAQAAQAALDMIQYSDNGGIHELYYDPVEPAKSYTRYFNERQNKENILVNLNAPTNDMYMLFPAFGPWNVNKELGTCATQWLIDSYDMADGTEPIIGYNADYSPIINPVSGYDDQNPYANRDPRLAQSVMYHGMTWPMVNRAPATVDITTPQNWGSGYFVTKFLDDRIDHMVGGTTSQNFIMMRYAEVLLNYAEAINEAENSALARERAVEQLNRIRHRGGITNPLVASDYNQATLRERIRKERRVELSWEEHRFFDIRRWKIANEVMRRPATGIVIENGQFVRVLLDTRAYSERMDLLPIPLAEVNNSPLIYQNPGY